MAVSRQHGFRLFSCVAVIVALGAGYLVYMPGLSGPFLFDDLPNIVNNAHLNMTALTWNQVMAAAFSSHAGPLYRPIAMASFALNDYFGGLHPYGFKLTNVIIHLACGVLVIVLSRLLLSSYRNQHAPWLSPERVRWVALLVAAAWIVHPLNLTAVLYVVQRMVSLASFFMLASICFYVVGRRRQIAGRSGWALIWIGAPIMGFFAVFSKEIAALIPVYLVVIEAVIFRFRGTHTRYNRSIIAFFTLSLAIPFLFGLGWLVTHGSQFLNGYHNRDFTLPQRLMTEARVVMLNIKWTLAPTVADLSLYHDDIAASKGMLAPVTTLLSCLGVVALLGLAWLTRRRAPLVTLGLLWFLGGHALESTILPLELVHEHRNYLPSFGLLLALGSLLLLVRKPTRGFVIAGTVAAMLFVGLLGHLTWVRSTEWSSMLTQTYYEAQHHPHSERSAYAFAAAEANLAMQGRLAEPGRAIADLEKSASQATSIMPHVALIMVASKRGQPVRPQWLAQIRAALGTKRINSQDINSLKALIRCQTRFCKLDKAQVKRLFDALLANPKLGHGANYANALTIRINALTHQGAPLKKLISLMYKVISIKPDEPQYRINLANALIADNDVGRARQQIAKLQALNTVGQLDRAINRLERAMQARGASDATNKASLPRAPSGADDTGSR